MSYGRGRSPVPDSPMRPGCLGLNVADGGRTDEKRKENLRERERERERESERERETRRAGFWVEGALGTRALRGPQRRRV